MSTLVKMPYGWKSHVTAQIFQKRINLGSADQKLRFLNIKGIFRKAVWGHSQHAQNKYRKRQIIRKKEGYVDEEDEVDEDE